MNGVPVPVVSRLLGHSNVSMTLRYAHLGDRDIEAATERVGLSDKPSQLSLVWRTIESTLSSPSSV